ncbi:hypothetical protein KQI08_09840 [Paraeggerthella hongkongensis]|uniref:hypothetical protein n=1 Tax=Paraeggerthella hominis TaxID=2897351 RepID=UPI001C11A052|nr:MULTISPECIES: hypothetical protein [Paraeggerthella]MBU5406206.1 hypothetical protein [Paraeggerthella hongkongensis]MCD2434055.1 hypothetical protein [Paraeggerthella hominis]
MTGHEIERSGKTMKKCLAKRQLVHHIFVTHPEHPCSERSFYRDVEAEAIAARKIDPRKKVKYKERNKKHPHEEGFYEGRIYSDYPALDEGIRATVVQIDCVEGGRRGMYKCF